MSSSGRSAERRPRGSRGPGSGGPGPAGFLADVDALVDGGRRAPGSDAERRAARYVEDRLRRIGREVDVESIDVWPGWPLGYALLAALAVVASLVSTSTVALGVGLALLAVLLTLLDAAILIPTARRALGRRASQNVVSWGDRERPGALVLVAHLDAGRAGLVMSERWSRRLAALGRALGHPLGGTEPLVWLELAVLACCALRALGVGGAPLTVVQFAVAVALLAAIGLLVDVAISGTKGGENDNASGAALALALAERLHAKAPEHFGVHVLLTGGQKAGAAGMRAFVGAHRGELALERTVFLNLDAVGAGAVRYTRREGPLLALRTHAQLAKLCDEIADDDDQDAFGARPLVSRAASDAYVARTTGYPAITITCRDDRDHLPGRVEQEAIERAEGFCAELIDRLEAEIGPDLAAPVEETVLSEAEGS
jgi:Peptidase family M28